MKPSLGAGRTAGNREITKPWRGFYVLLSFFGGRPVSNEIESPPKKDKQKGQKEAVKNLKKP